MNSSENSFNLVDEKWIPIAGRGYASLYDIFSGAGMSHLGGNPVEKIVVFRLLLAICHAAVELPDDEASQHLSTTDLADAAREYLRKWHECFYLHGEQPFLQFKALANEKFKKDETWLLRVNASNNKAMLSNWEWSQRKESISNEESTMLLLNQSCFGCAGYKSNNKDKLGGNYIVLTPGYRGKFKDGEKPGQLGKGILLGDGFVHSYYYGENILESLILNMLTDADLKKLNIFPEGLGRPFWEEMPVGEDCPRARQYRNSYQGQLFPLDKFLYVDDNNEFFTITDGIKYADDCSLPEPAFILVGKGRDERFMRVRQDKRIWRELPAILSFLAAENSRPRPYFLSFGISRLRERKKDGQLAVWAGGMSVSSTAGVQVLQGKDDYLESIFSFPVQCFGDVGLGNLTKLIERSDEYSEILRNAIFNYSKHLQPNVRSRKDDVLGNALSSKALAIYWSKLEAQIEDIIDIAFSEDYDADKQKNIFSNWRCLVNNIYNDTCSRETSRQLMAWTDAMPNFNSNKAGKKK